jgi:hypothetical protein
MRPDRNRATGSNQQAIDYGTALSGVRMPNEEQVFFYAGWEARILHQVRIDFIPAVFQVAHQRFPLTQCVLLLLVPMGFFARQASLLA